MKKWGRKRIEKELLSRDISSYNIKQGLSEIEEEEYQHTLLELAEKKYQQTTENHSLRKRKKVADFLLRKGFESQKIYAVLLDLENGNQS